MLPLLVVSCGFGRPRVVAPSLLSHLLSLPSAVGCVAECPIANGGEWSPAFVIHTSCCRTKVLKKRCVRVAAQHAVCLSGQTRLRIGTAHRCLTVSVAGRQELEALTVRPRSEPGRTSTEGATGCAWPGVEGCSSVVESIKSMLVLLYGISNSAQTLRLNAYVPLQLLAQAHDQKCNARTRAVPTRD